VTVLDRTPPAMFCSSNIVAECSDPTGTTVAFTVAALDNCAGALAAVCLPPSNSSFPRGTTLVVCKAADGNGNTNTCSFSVIVADTIAPVINCSTNISTATDTGQCFRSNLTYSVTAADACDGPVTVNCTPPSNSTFSKGITPVNCLCSDSASNSQNCNFTVTVTDVEPPVIACPTNIVVECAAPGGTVVAFTATASDICEGAVLVSCLPASNSTFARGTTPVVCKAGSG